MGFIKNILYQFVFIAVCKFIFYLMKSYWIILLGFEIYIKNARNLTNYILKNKTLKQ